MVRHVCCHCRCLPVRPVAWSRLGAGCHFVVRLQLAYRGDVVDPAAGTHCRRVRIRRAHHGRAWYVADGCIRTDRRGHAGLAAPLRPATHGTAVDGIGHRRPRVAPAAAWNCRTAARFAGGAGRHGHGQRGVAAAGEALFRRSRRWGQHALHHRAAGRHPAAGIAGGTCGRCAGLAQLDGGVGAAGTAGIGGLGDGADQPPPSPCDRAGTGHADARSRRPRGTHRPGLEHGSDLRHDLAGHLFDVHLVADAAARSRRLARVRRHHGGAVRGTGHGRCLDHAGAGSPHAQPVSDRAAVRGLPPGRVCRAVVGATGRADPVGDPARPGAEHVPAGIGAGQSAQPHCGRLGGPVRVLAGHGLCGELPGAVPVRLAARALRRMDVPVRFPGDLHPGAAGRRLGGLPPAVAGRRLGTAAARRAFNVPAD